MVGDALTDLASARGAGVTAVAALWGETAEEETAARPDPTWCCGRPPNCSGSARRY